MWGRGEHEVLNLSVNEVKGLTVEQTPVSETLVATFGDRSPMHDLRFTLKPNVHMYWGSDPG